MDQLESVLDAAVDATASSFLNCPANYSDERSLAEDVRSRLCGILTPASVADVTVEESSGARGTIRDHEAYTGQYHETEYIDRAQCEIGGSTFPFGGSERLDLGVFSDGLSIALYNGTQEFDPGDLEAAIEFKYVKNTNYLRYRPDDVHSKYRDIEADIERLASLSDGIERRCVIFSNYDLLRRENQAERELQQLATRENIGLRFVSLDPVQCSDI